MSKDFFARLGLGRPKQRKRRRTVPKRTLLAAEQLEHRELLDAGLSSVGALASAVSAPFVAGLYQDLLSRDPQPAEQAASLTALASGATPEQIALGIASSAEFRGNLITADYQNFLGRYPSATEVANWLSRMDAGMTADQVAAHFLSSDEYHSDHGANNTNWLAGLYQDVLNRTPDASGLAQWQDELQQGVSRLQVAFGIVQSPEAETRVVSADYQRMLRRDPDPIGLTAWVTALENGTSNAQVLAKIAGSPEYVQHYATTTLDSAAGSGSTTASASRASATPLTGDPGSTLTIPVAHARIWWTPARLAQAQQWYADHPFRPSSSNAWDNAFVYVLTGQNQYAQTAINLLMNFTITDIELQQVAVDAYRWGDWVPVVYDWCYNAMTPLQQQTFMDRYNNYVTTIMQKPWGGPAMPANNYFWGYWRNEVNWAIATWYENPLAQSILNDALVTRWQDAFLPWAAADGQGGVTPEGTQYGRYMLAYTVVPFETLKLFGRDLLQETNFFKEAAINLIYTTTPARTAIKGNASRPYYQVFPFGDDENNGGYPTAATDYYGNFMTMVADEWSTQPVGQYARQWLHMVHPPVQNFVAAVDPGGEARSFSHLPLDYYVPGTEQILYTRNQWGANATSIFLKLGQGTDASHLHLDIGTFQIWRDGYYLSKESTGYAMQFNGGTDSQTISTNGILFNGIGEANAYANGPAQILRLESTPLYSYAAVDLSQVYRASDSPDPARDDNPYAGSIVREFIFIKRLQAMIILDRLSANGTSTLSADNVPKTFLLHLPKQPQFTSANTFTEVNGSQALRVTSLLSPSPQWQVVDEGAFTGTHFAPSYYQYRLEENVSGSPQSYFLHVLQASNATATAVTAQVTAEDANSWTITLTDPGVGTAVITLNKGMTSTGGAIGFSASGVPTLSPLTNSVESIQVTNNGPVWG